MKRSFLALVTLAAACSRAPQSPVDRLAPYLSADATVLAGVDLDRLRGAPLFAKLPESLREGSYALAAYNGRDLVTATRVADRVVVAGPAGKGAPADLVRRAAGAPIWIVARGSATLPFTGNFANINRLLHQTEYTTVTARVGERIDIHAEGICRSADEAQHLEENIRAIGSLMKVPLEVTREGSIVRVNASAAADALGKLF